MQIDLSKEDLEHIESWYASASGESATDRSESMFALLEKLGIEATSHDLYPPDPTHWVESHQPIVMAQLAAIKAYRERHPEINDAD